MDERLIRRYEILASLLTDARDELDIPQGQPSWINERLVSFNEFMEHREFELALDILQDVGGEIESPASFWRKLKQAADLMGLEDCRNDLHSEYREDKERERAA